MRATIESERRNRKEKTPLVGSLPTVVAFKTRNVPLSISIRPNLIRIGLEPERPRRGPRRRGLHQCSKPYPPSGYTVARPGRLAQLGEHQLDKLGVTGSSPVPPTRKAPASPGAFRLSEPRISPLGALVVGAGIPF